MRRRFFIAVFLVAITSGCAYRAIDSNSTSYVADKLASELDPFLLAEGYAQKLIVEVDWVEGCKPGPKTIAGLSRLLDRYLADGLGFEIALGDEIPLEVWTPLASESDGVEQLVRRFAAGAPSEEAGVEHRYILFLPRAGGRNGYATTWVVERDGRFDSIQGLVVARDIHARQAKLWLSRDKMERMTVIHEFGHVFGLVTNDTHERVHPAHRHHCTRLKCLMAHPTSRVIARNAPAGVFNIFMSDYCTLCQADIRGAKEYWRRQESMGTSYREARIRERAASHGSAVLQKLRSEQRYDELFSMLDTYRGSFPDSPFWDGIHGGTLMALGRFEEAVTLLESGLQTDPSAVDYMSDRVLLARYLVALGRHTEAVELLDPQMTLHAWRQGQVGAFLILKNALVGLGRYREGIDLCDSVLEHEEARSFPVIGILREKADLLRRAGSLAAAETLIVEGLSRKKTRSSWLRPAIDLRRGQGRSGEALDLLSELKRNVEKNMKRSNSPRAHWAQGWMLVRIEAELGATEQARTRAQALKEAGPPKGSHPTVSIHSEAIAWMALSDFDRAAKAVGSVSAEHRGYLDPCGLEPLAPLRLDESNPVLSFCPRPVN